MAPTYGRSIALEPWHALADRYHLELHCPRLTQRHQALFCLGRCLRLRPDLTCRREKCQVTSRGLTSSRHPTRGLTILRQCGARIACLLRCSPCRPCVWLPPLPSATFRHPIPRFSCQVTCGAARVSRMKFPRRQRPCEGARLFSRP